MDKTKMKTATKQIKKLATITALLAITQGCDTVNQEYTFTDTGLETSGGFNIFRYHGPNKSRSEISDRFNAWDKLIGDHCKNTGYLNVIIPDHDLITADCGNSHPNRPHTKVDRRNAQVKHSIDRGQYDLNFLDAVEDLCERLDMDAMGLLSIMDYHTKGTFDNNLIGLNNRKAQSVGTTSKALAKMDQTDQLDYVERYFRQHPADYSDTENIALATILPRAIGNPNYIVGNKRGSKPRRRAYRKSLDTNQDSKVTAREYVDPALKRRYTSPRFAKRGR